MLKFCYYFLLPIILVSLLSLSACQTVSYDSDILADSHQAGIALVQQLPKDFPKQEKKILPVVFVDINRLGQTSPFGRMQAETVASQLAVLGLQVMEIRLAETPKIQPEQGEFMLSRNLSQLGKQYQADIILSGTYTTAKNKVYINSRLVDPKNQHILAAYSYEMPIGDNTRALLRPNIHAYQGVH